MNKFLQIGNYNLGADVIYVALSGLPQTITLSYSDKQLVLSGAGDFTPADQDLIEDAVVNVWAQPYTESTINVTLSQAITGVA
jgi:hypothetical protein